MPGSAAAFCVWFEAVRRARAAPEELARGVLGEAPHTLVADRDGHARGLPEAVAQWVARGARASLALPVPGDPVGLGGPAAFNHAALEAGEAVVLAGAGVGLVPRLDARVLVWDELPADAPPYHDAREAGRELRACLLESTRRLVDLDVAAWRPEIPDLLMNVRHRPPARLPGPWDPGRVETLERALLCREVVGLALSDDGGAVSAHEMTHRREALRDLDRAARRALAAVCSDSLDSP